MEHGGRFAVALRGVAALVVGCALIVGLPALLIKTVGNPLPSSIPTLAEVESTLTQGGDGFASVLLGVLATAVWVLWLQLVIALAVEAVALARGRETTRLPLAPGVQVLAARLLGGIWLAAVVAASSFSAPAAATVLAFSAEELPTMSAPQDLSEADRVATPIPVAHATTPGVPAAQSRLGVEITVTRDVEIWDLAETFYGDGSTWRKIIGSNLGRIGSGGTIIGTGTDRVSAGTHLLVPEPSGADTRAAASFAAALLDDAEHRVVAGESMWTIAAATAGSEAPESEVAEYWAAVRDANADRVSSGDPDLIYPGELLTMPPMPSLAEDLQLDTSSYEIDSDAHVQSHAELDQGPTWLWLDDAPSESAGSNSAVVLDIPMDLPASPAMDEGIEALNRRPSVEPVAATAPERLNSEPAAEAASTASADRASHVTEVVEVEQVGGDESQSSSERFAVLVTFGGAFLAAGVVAALRRRREVQRRQRPAGASLPVVRSEAAALELALTHAAESGSQAATSSAWRTASVADVAELRGEAPIQLLASRDGSLRAELIEGSVDPDLAVSVGAAERSVPVLVGTDSISGDAGFLDLAIAGAVSVEGEHEAISQFARTSALELAVADRIDDVCVVLVEAASAPTNGLDRLTRVSTWSEASAHSMSCPHQEGEPLVIFSAVAPPLAVRESLRSAGALVIAPGAAGPISIHLSSNRVVVEPGAREFVPIALAEDELDQIDELIEASTSEATVHVPVEIDTATAPPTGVESVPIEVRVLGPVEVVGAAAFSSLKAVDVIAYLAFHRSGADADQIKSWVWPPFEPPSNKAFANVLSRARRGIGLTDDGQPLLSRAGSDRLYRLESVVQTDFERFEQLVGVADTADDESDKLAALQEALGLIRGVPFSGGAASTFAWADNGIRARVEFVVDETAHRAADVALAAGDLETARWAAMRGLQVVPGCEGCFERRFRVAAAAENRSELRRAMADLESAATLYLGEVEAADSISSDLLALYADLDRSLAVGVS